MGRAVQEVPIGKNNILKQIAFELQEKDEDDQLLKMFRSDTKAHVISHKSSLKCSVLSFDSVLSVLQGMCNS